MSAGPIPVLFVHYGEQWIRGSEQVLLDLMRRLDPARVRPILWTNGTEMAAIADGAGIAVHRSDFAYYLDAGSPWPNPVRYAGLVREGLGLVRRHGARVIHANSAAPVQWMLPVARISRRKLLVHLHISYLRRSRAVLMIRRADRAVGVSAQVLAGVLADGMPAERTEVLHNGIDCAGLLARPARDLRGTLGLAPGTLVLATVGYLVRMKGHDVLLRALTRLATAPPPVLLVAGDGPDRAALEALAGSLGLGERVRFLGHVADVTAVYRAADVVVQASRNEGFGLSVAEASLFARPVVASRVGGIPEVVTDGETGVLVPPEDPDALAAALDRVLADPALRERLGRAAAARVEREFDLGRVAERFMALHAEMAGAGPSGARR